MIRCAHRSFLRAGLLAAAMLFAGCQSTDEDPTPTADPSPTARPSLAASESIAPSTDQEGEETSAFELRVGDCFSVQTDELSSVIVVSCAEPHEYEVFALLEHPAGPAEQYPGEGELLGYADMTCQPPFEAYVGHDYQASLWYITSLTPSELTWADGDRMIACTLNQQDADQEPIAVTRSAEGAAE